MIDLVITETCKRHGSRENWSRFNDEVQHFADLEDAREYLKSRYGKCSTHPMYQDTTSKGTLHIGRVYGFREMENDVQSWVSFYDGKTRLPINPKTGAPYYTDEEARKLRDK